MKKAVLFAILYLVFCISVFAQTAVITEITGTVEIRRAGQTAWETARAGQSIAMDTLVSTGFRSTALIRAGSTVITVRPLTRLSVTELAAAAGTETLNVSLQTGRVRVEVQPPPGTRANVELRGPVITASVRGTVFEIDTLNMSVSEGTVVLSSNTTSFTVVVDGGRHSYADEQSGRTAAPEAASLAELTPQLPVTTGSVNAAEAINASDTQITAGAGTVEAKIIYLP